MGEPSLVMISADQLTRSVSRVLNNSPYAPGTKQSVHLNANGSTSRQKKPKTVTATKKRHTALKKKYKHCGEDAKMKKPESPTKMSEILPAKPQVHELVSDTKRSKHPITQTRFILPRMSDQEAVDQLLKLVHHPVVVPSWSKGMGDNSAVPREHETPKKLLSCNAGNHVQIPSDLYVSGSRKMPCNLSEILSSASVEVCGDGEDSVNGLSNLNANIACDNDLVSSQTLHPHAHSNLQHARNIYEFDTEIRRAENSRYDLRESAMIASRDSHMISLSDGRRANDLQDAVGHEQYMHLHQDTSQDSDFGRLVIAHQSDSLAMTDNVPNTYTPISLPETSPENSAYDTLYHSNQMNQDCYASHMRQSSAENNHYTNLAINNANVHQSLAENSQYSDMSLHNTNNALPQDDRRDSYAHMPRNDGAYQPVYPRQNTNDNRDYQSFAIHSDNNLPRITDNSDLEYSNLSTNHEPEIVAESNVNASGFCDMTLPQSDATSTLVYPDTRPDGSASLSYSDPLDRHVYESATHDKPGSLCHLRSRDLSRGTVPNSDVGSFDSIPANSVRARSPALSQPICHPSEYQSVARLLTSPKIGQVAGPSHCWNNSIVEHQNRIIPALPVLDFLLKSQPREKQLNHDRQRLVVPYELSRLLSNPLPAPTEDHHSLANPLSQHCQQLLSISSELQLIANQLNCNNQVSAQQELILSNENVELTANNDNDQVEDDQSDNTDGTDETNYCVECNLSYLTPCTTHNITYTTVQDSPVLSKARMSLPPQLCLKHSQTSPTTTAVLGVWSKENIARYTRFGPMVGRYTRPSKDDMRSAGTTRNVWKIIYRGQREAIDASDETTSNWMMFVAPAPTVAQQNLVAYQQRRRIYFVTCRDVDAGQELLLWYAADYVLLLGLPSKPDEFKHCPTCRKQLPNASALKQHMRYTHPDTTHRKWKCSMCDRVLVTRAKLRIHTLAHVGIKPHRCLYCNKSFTDMSNLRHHETIHTGVKKFECAECSKTFRLKAHLESHAVCHAREKRYQCRFCDAMIARPHDLRKHELQHTQEVTYPCDECDKTFHLQRNLARHKKIHEGSKSFTCGKCSKGFITRYHRNRHSGKCKARGVVGGVLGGVVVGDVVGGVVADSVQQT